MNEINKNQENVPWYIPNYVWLIIFFPLLAVIGGITTIILAIQSDDGLVVDDYYKQGLEINRVIERDNNAVTYQLDADIKIDHQYNKITIRLLSDNKFTLPNKITASMLYSTRSGFDKKIDLKLVEDNIYESVLPSLIPGKWYVHIIKDDWRLIKTINIYTR